MLLSDQHRADVLGAAGHPVVLTPSLDALAAEATLFESAYCQGTLCLPARASLLTGRYVRDHGVPNNSSRLAGGLHTAVEALKLVGYHTAAIGDLHLYPPEVTDGQVRMRDYGFAEVRQISGKAALGMDAWAGEQAVRWIESAERRSPFFVWIGFPGPRDPWDAPVDVADASRKYFANLTTLDVAIGRVVEALRSCQLLDSSWIIYTSDHGEMLGSHGLFGSKVFYEAAVRVPMIIRPPGGGPHRKFSDLVEHVDLSATMLDIAGARPASGAPGRTLADIAEGSRATGRSVVVSEILGFGMWRTERHKLVVRERGESPVQFFDLVNDPDEEHNLVSDPDSGDLIGDLMHDYVHRFLASSPFRPR